jgi:hypothetical protein
LRRFGQSKGDITPEDVSKSRVGALH